MRLTAFLLLFTALTAAAWAGPAGRNSDVRLTDCDTEARTAQFQAEMMAFKRAVGLSLRFTLQARDAANPQWRRIVAPGFGQWLSAAEGRRGYVYDKSVENLPAGADYRVIVRFRWRDRAGQVVARAAARSRPCRQPDRRANLQAERISETPGPSPDTRIYTVRVVNAGETEAPPFFTRLVLDDTSLGEDDTALELAPGEGATLEFEGPPCAAGSTLTATVDVKAEVDESDELDNTLTESCQGSRAGL